MLTGSRALKSGSDQADMLRASGNAAMVGSAVSVLATGANAYGNWKRIQPKLERTDMPRIPTGNFGNVIAQPAPCSGTERRQQPRRRGRQRSDNAMRAMGGMIEEENRQQQALDRAKSANALLDREMQALRRFTARSASRSTTVRCPTPMRRTSIPSVFRNSAPRRWEGPDPVTAENLTKGFKRAEFKGEMAIDGLVSKAKVADFRAQTDGTRTSSARRPGFRYRHGGSNCADRRHGRDWPAVYGAAWDKRKQDWKDNSWGARVTRMAIDSRNDMRQIDSLLQQVTRGDENAGYPEGKYDHCPARVLQDIADPAQRGRRRQGAASRN